MNNYKKFIIFLIIYFIVTILFGILYFKFQLNKASQKDRLWKWAQLLSHKSQLEDLEFRKDKNGEYVLNKDTDEYIDKHNLMDYIYFSTVTFSTVGYYNILQNTTAHIIINVIQLIIVILIIPILIFIFNQDFKSFLKNITIEFSVFLFFAIMYKIANYLDVKNKAKYDDFMFSIPELKLLKIKKKDNKLKFIPSKKLWYQWIKYTWRDCFYWSLITQSRVGYGSVWYPVTWREEAVNYVHQVLIIFITCLLIYKASKG